MSLEAVPYAARMAALARADPGAPALVLLDPRVPAQTVTRGELDELALRAASALVERGVDAGHIVVVSLSNSAEHYAACIGAWKLGACVLPLDPRLPELVREDIYRVAAPGVVVAGERDPLLETVTVADLRRAAPTPIADRREAGPGKAIASGGSTGRPKIIVDPRPWAFMPGRAAGTLGERLGMRPGQRQLIPGPLYHNTAFTWGALGLADEHTLVVLRRFDADLAWQAFTRYGVEFAGLVPTMMGRMLRARIPEPAELEGVESVFHAGASCPRSVKRGWIELLGPERLHEAYGSTEGVGSTLIRGDEWLAHEGSVGRPFECDLRIVADDGTPAAPGEVGEIYMRPHHGRATFQYLGGDAHPDSDGFESVGDLGHVDADGYLYLDDRRTDLIVSGGVNVYPAEVEAALHEHSAVRDAVVIGLPDDDWGQRVHAIVETGDDKLAVHELEDLCRNRLARSKAPKSFEIVEELPRSPTGKINRSALRAERLAGERRT